MKHKRFVCFFILLTIMTTFFGTTAFADNNSNILSVKVKDGRTVNFTINEGLKPDIRALEEIAAQNIDAANITIIDICKARPASLEEHYVVENLNKNSAQATLGNGVPILPIPYTLEKSEKEFEVFVKDSHMASCARGETKTVTSTISASIEPSYTGLVQGLELKGKITYSITAGTTLTGPPESSPYNSREYRCMFFENKGVWLQWWLFTDGTYWPLSGTYREPESSYSYSIDRTIN